MIAGLREEAAPAVVDRLGARFTQALAGHIGPGDRVVFVDFPNHPNVGDSAIWLGTLAALRRIGANVVLSIEYGGYDRRLVDRALGKDGKLLLHGGGNFGDIWPVLHEFRLQVLADFPDRRIVMAPQTSRFRTDSPTFARTAEVLSARPDVTLMWRDRTSLALAQEHFDCGGELVPDAAFGIGSLAPGPAQTGELWLTRTDGERSGEQLLPEADDAVAVDWLSERRGDVGWSERYARARAWNFDYVRPLTKRAPHELIGPISVRLHERAARMRLATGVRLLSRGHTVVTDRLHGHILATMLGRPNVVVDTGYGKLAGFMEAWTGGAAGVRAASSSAAAAEAAAELREDRV